MSAATRLDVHAALVGTYPPRPCGIGTFTRDLAQGLRELPQPVGIVLAAINGAAESYDYDPIVRYEMEEGSPESYVEVAQRLNASRNVDVVCMQHDFGKFGLWRDGFEEDYIVPMLEVLRKPVVITLHAVTPHPNELMQRTVQAMGQRAHAIVVMANIAKVLLQEDYGLDDGALAKVYQIPHGVPACQSSRHHQTLDRAKRALGLAGHRIVSTFGLINEGKGIEYAIEAMPQLVATYPDLWYLVIGETHPEVRKLRGEGYRNELVALTRRLRVERHVRFVNRFLAQHELVRYLTATDVYVTPYLARYQITSGTLAYALGCGKAVVSTPYLYAAEALAESRGLLAEFRSADSLANAIDQLLGNPSLRRYVEEQATKYGQEMAWGRVAQRYRELFCEVLGRPATAVHVAQDSAPEAPAPELAGAGRASG